MRKTTINKIICDFAFVMSIMIIIVCIPSFSVQAKEQNPLYSYVDSKTDLCGFVDKNGKVVIDPAYDTVCDFSDGLAAVQNSDGKWGFIDKTGKVVVPLVYRMCGDFSEGLASVETEDEKWGYVNTQGNIVIAPEYIGVSAYSEGLACVRTKSGKYGKYGYIDKKGKMVIKSEV